MAAGNIRNLMYENYLIYYEFSSFDEMPGYAYDMH